MEQISLCMIVKNEAHRLAACLSAAAPCVDEIIVVDTGSTDNTVKIAGDFGTTIDHFPWRNHFAQARNHAFDLATKEWLLILDADEILVTPNPNLLRLIIQDNVDAYAIRLINYFSAGGNSAKPKAYEVIRLLRKTPEVRYIGRIHEELTTNDRAIIKNAPPELQIHHYGYALDETQARRKANRNLEFLKEALTEEQDPRRILRQKLNLATEYQQLGRFADAIKAYTLLLDDPAAQGQFFVPSAMAFRLECLMQLGHFAAALAESARILELFPEYTEVLNWRADLLAKQGRLQEAETAYLTALKHPRHRPRLENVEPRIRAICWFNLANIYIAAKNLHLAAQCLAEALLEDPPLTTAKPKLLAVLQKLPSASRTSLLSRLFLSKPSLRPLLEEK